ncbi:hypothetical protein BAV2271, partial [Bordetella avium 197N]
VCFVVSGAGRVDAREASIVTTSSRLSQDSALLARSTPLLMFTDMSRIAEHEVGETAVRRQVQ